MHARERTDRTHPLTSTFLEGFKLLNNLAPGELACRLLVANAIQLCAKLVPPLVATAVLARVKLVLDGVLSRAGASDASE